MIWHMGLLENQDRQCRLRTELHEAGVRPGTSPLLSTVSKLPYLHNIIRETLRRHSPIPDSLKRTMKQGQAMEIMGFQIPSGVSLLHYPQHKREIDHHILDHYFCSTLVYSSITNSLYEA